MADLLRAQLRGPWWKRQDWLLTTSALGLVVIGTALIWSATRPMMLAGGGDPNSFLKKQLIIILIALLLGWAVARAPYMLLRAIVPFLYLAGIAGLVLVLMIGVEINGIKAWIRLPAGFTLQPSEFAKLAIVVGASMVLAETRQRTDAPGRVQVVLTLAMAGLPAALIMLQPDLGTTLVIGTTLLGILAVSSVDVRWLIGLAGAAFAVVVAALTIPGILSDYQWKRLLVFLDPNVDPTNAGYTLIQVKLAIGSGGWFGTGLFNGPQTNGRFIPEQQTDFIFSAAGEQLGFLGSATIVLLLLVVAWRALMISFASTDKFGRIAAAGIACWIAFQAFENLGMNLGMMPVTGVPLPFVSYGGSSLFALAMAVGLLQNIRMKVAD